MCSSALGTTHTPPTTTKHSRMREQQEECEVRGAQIVFSLLNMAIQVTNTTAFLVFLSSSSKRRHRTAVASPLCSERTHRDTKWTPRFGSHIGAVLVFCWKSYERNQQSICETNLLPKSAAETAERANAFVRRDEAPPAFVLAMLCPGRRNYVRIHQRSWCHPRGRS